MPVLALLLDCCLLSCVSEATYILRTCDWVDGAILVFSGFYLHNSSCASSASLICAHLCLFFFPDEPLFFPLLHDGDYGLSYALKIPSFADLPCGTADGHLWVFLEDSFPFGSLCTMLLPSLSA